MSLGGMPKKNNKQLKKKVNGRSKFVWPAKKKIIIIIIIKW